ncbi:hypothetical protein EPIR_1712 [Erwinia piriflorinigrans CFBP 5888]|uniref:Uncharacterized protein n=2 Tax=Erwinia piriflorinigrans TaxID=665097 RepID=V5Z819_9GAMM|nr:hypothetical protein EPIR_1712 [Erwinia piriflorinigrans CFBP 5888]
MLSVSNFVILMTNSTRTLFNKMTADSIRRMVGAAINAGKHIIASAKQNFSGALTSGIVGSGVQVGSGVNMCKAIKNENKSINGNLKAANIKSLEIKENQDNIQQVLQQLKKEGKSPDDDVIQNMTKSHNKLQAEAANHQIDHQKNANKTYQMRAKTDLVNQLNHSGQQAIVAGFGINAATETSQAEVLKSGQQVHHDVSDNHKQRNKGSEETQASINQFVESWIANNNSAASAIAGR